LVSYFLIEIIHQPSYKHKYGSPSVHAVSPTKSA
jgi:hypothetical protein